MANLGKSELYRKVITRGQSSFFISTGYSRLFIERIAKSSKTLANPSSVPESESKQHKDDVAAPLDHESHDLHLEEEIDLQPENQSSVPEPEIESEQYNNDDDEAAPLAHKLQDSYPETEINPEPDFTEIRQPGVEEANGSCDDQAEKMANYSSGNKDTSSQPRQNFDGRGRDNIDVLFVTAAFDELDAVEVYQSASDEKWEQHRFENFTYISCKFRSDTNTNFKIAAIELPKMGSSQSMYRVSSMVKKFHPKMIAMVGICAGYREEVNIGDILVADNVFDSNCLRVGALSYQWNSRVKKHVSSPHHEGRLEKLVPNIAHDRPYSYEYQKNHFLEFLDEEKTFPIKDLNDQFIQYENKGKECNRMECVIENLIKDGLLKVLDEKVIITPKGKEEVLQFKMKKKYIDKEVPNLRIYDFYTSASSLPIQDDYFFANIRKSDNLGNVCALEMEGSAFVRLVADELEKKWIIVKGVSDYGDTNRSQNTHFRRYASSASVRFLIAFLKKEWECLFSPP